MISDNIDASVRPQDDFYGYACGGWMKKHPLKPEFARFGMFDLLRENAREQLRNLITSLGDNPESKVTGTNAQKVYDLYLMGMDAERLNREKGEPLKPIIEQIMQFDPNKDMARLMGFLHSGVAGSFFSSGVGGDPTDSNINILHIGETGLGLGDRDYYLEETDDALRIREAYREYIVKIMMLAGYDNASAQRVRDTVMEIETKLAKYKKTREERRNPILSYNPMSYSDFCDKYSGFDWNSYFATLGVTPPDSLNVSSPKFLEFVIPYISTLNAQQIRDMVIFEAISEASGLLSDEFHDANFEMFDRVMSGIEEQKPRWKRAMAIPGSMLGEAVGQLYVQSYFPPSHKEAMLKLVENLRNALGEHIDNLEWMSAATKLKAREKLSRMTVKIGYPDKWKDYSEILIDPQKSYLHNVLEAAKWYIADNYKKLGKPVDKTEWHMTPQTVNAYYSPVVNEICFPAAILQPPYFDPNASDPLNYGAIGVVIGHEMTHGFDDQGRQFDANGNLSDWWSPEDATAFNALADKLVDQFDKVEVAPGVYANGRYTLGENIADQGGLRVAYTALQHVLDESKKNKAEDVCDGFTADQLFYLSYAGVWANNIRPEEILLDTKTDPHSLGCNRVNVTLRNIAPFFETFNVKPGDAMWRPQDEQVIIW